jgi:hypothetical protein
MDHRCGTRIPCDFHVLVMVYPAVFGPGVLLNVSSSGALLQTPLVLSPLTQIELEVESPGMGRSSIMASVTRREVNQYGVAFRGASSTVVGRILRLAQSHAEAVRVATSDEPPRQHHYGTGADSTHDGVAFGSGGPRHGKLLRWRHWIRKQESRNSSAARRSRVSRGQERTRPRGGVVNCDAGRARCCKTSARHLRPSQE